jgi:hypothetical protein
MKAFVTVVVLLGVLAGCGQQAASDQAAGPTSETSGTSQSGQPPKSEEPPATVVEPTPPAGKPQNPTSGEPPVTLGPDGPVVPAGVTEVPASQIDASALPTYFEYGNRVWAFNGGFSLQFFAAAPSSCSGMSGQVVDQAPDLVKIVVQAMDQPQGGRPDDSICASVMTPTPVVVTLDTPLRDRKILLSEGR